MAVIETDEEVSALLTDPKVSACMVLYHSGEEALRAARCVNDSVVPVTFYVVDNSPEDDTADEIKRQYPRTTVLRMKKNVGYGAGNNAVIPKLKTKYHIVMNPDITFAPDLIKRMMDFMDANPKVTILSPRVFSPDGTEQFLPRCTPTVRYLLGGRRAARGDRHGEKARALRERAAQTEAEAVEAWKRNKEKPGLRSLLRANRLETVQSLLKKRADRQEAICKRLHAWRDEYTLADTRPSEPTEIQFASGCFFMIRTHIYYRMKGFDPRFFLYHEDSDLSLSALEYGKIVYHPDMEVTHAWHRDSSRSLKPALRHIVSTVKFFNKWGWRW